MKIKTIQYKKTRKLNPELISPKFTYMSEEVEAGAWADINEEENEQESMELLSQFVDGHIEAQVEGVVTHYRTISNSRNVYYNEIEPAFYELMRSQNLPDEDIRIAYSRFVDLLEFEMAKRTM